jgi:hypothetical protein
MGVSTVRAYVGDMRGYTSRGQVAAIACPSFITDNETDPVSTGQGQELYEPLTCPKEFRRFLRAEGAEGNGPGRVLDRRIRLARYHSRPRSPGAMTSVTFGDDFPAGGASRQEGTRRAAIAQWQHRRSLNMFSIEALATLMTCPRTTSQ